MKNFLKICVALMGMQSIHASSVGLKVSTLGFGVEYAKYINASFKMRLQGNYFSYAKTFDKIYTTPSSAGPWKNIRVDLKIPSRLRLFSMGGLVDWHPFQNGFSVNAGLFYNGNRVDTFIEPKNDVKTPNATHSKSVFGKIDGWAEFNKISPYLGMRYESHYQMPSSWNFFMEGGCLYQGNIKIQKVLPKGKVFSLAFFEKTADDLILKAYKNKAINWLKFYPVIGFGVSYKF